MGKTIKYIQTNPYGATPSHATPSSAGWDLYAGIPEPIVIQPHTVEKIDTGICVELPEETFGAIFPRSGLATNRGLRLANSVAVIDSDYRGSWIVPLYNDSQEPQVINPLMRIAQFIIIPYMAFEEIHLTQELDQTQRGSGGFGSTGI